VYPSRHWRPKRGFPLAVIYNSFDGKDAVFGRVMRHYNDTVVESRIREHLDGAKPTKGLVTLFESLLDEPDDKAFGCLLTNSAIEFAGSDTFASAEIRQGFERFLSAFSAALMGIRGADRDVVGRTFEAISKRCAGYALRDSRSQEPPQQDIGALASAWERRQRDDGGDQLCHVG
jgi:hypothetical protein